MGALEGLKVVEVGLAVQGPQAAALLGDWGAEVIKVELPGVGDASRSMVLSPDDRRSGYYRACNRGKRSVTADLRTGSGRQLFLRLTDRTDVVISNFKPGTMEGWSLGYDEVSAGNPMIVYAVGSTYGPLGPDAQQEGADLSGQAAGGLISMTGVEGGDPGPVGVTIADHVASQNLAAGILAALIARSRTGRGQRVDTSLLGGQIWAQASEFTTYLLSGRLPPKPNRGSAMVNGLYGLFPTADGWIAIVGVRSSHRPVFFATVGRPDLFGRFPQSFYTEDDKKAIYEELAPVFSGRSTDDWCEALRQAGIRHARVRDYAEIAADPGVWENGYLVHTPTGDTAVGTPVRFSDTPAAVACDAPELGQHTEEVMLELGYGWDDIARLAAEGAI